MENGLEKSKNVTKIVVDKKFAKFVTKIMVTKIIVTKLIVTQIRRPYGTTTKVLVIPGRL